MNLNLKDNNLDNNNNEAINMFNVYMFNVHVILNSFKIIILNIIMYKYIFLKLKIESVDSVKLCIKLQSELYESNLLTLTRFS